MTNNNLSSLSVSEIETLCLDDRIKNILNWDIISLKMTLSENFIRQFSDKVNWVYISSAQKLSEKFIREFSDKVDWYYIVKYQSLSEEFIIL